MRIRSRQDVKRFVRQKEVGAPGVGRRQRGHRLRQHDRVSPRVGPAKFFLAAGLDQVDVRQVQVQAVHRIAQFANQGLPIGLFQGRPTPARAGGKVEELLQVRRRCRLLAGPHLEVTELPGPLILVSEGFLCAKKVREIYAPGQAVAGAARRSPCRSLLRLSGGCRDQDTDRDHNGWKAPEVPLRRAKLSESHEGSF
jgi:hypothetical protein